MIDKPSEPIIQTDSITINQPRTLLQRYSINIDHLDFDYIKTTQNARELEKIVLILRSGEEGYFPDLTKCAEDRLKVIRPGSKILRTEQKIWTRDSMETNEWNSMTRKIEKWENEMKSCNNKLRNDNKNDNIDNELNYPPIRKAKGGVDTAIEKNKSTSLIKANCLQVCDYNKWDKYDADAEITKMDLHEERNRELQNMKMNREQNKLIEELDPDANIPVQLSEIEKDVHANRFKDRGNDLYRTKDYKEAIKEYSLSINMKPTAAAYNNRAMTYLKLNYNTKALNDCDECLKLDPLNIKAHLRKAQALLNQNHHREAFYTYETILSIDPENCKAQSCVNDLKKKFPDLVKSQKFRMKIDEDNGPPPLINSEPPQIIKESEKSQPIDEEEPVRDIDFAKLIIPNKIVKNRLPDAIKALSNLKTETTKKMRDQAIKRAESDNRNITILQPTDNNICKSPLIQEI